MSNNSNNNDDDDSFFAYTTAPSKEQVPLEIGSLVQLHSLINAVALNGKSGLVTGHEASTG